MKCIVCRERKPVSPPGPHAVWCKECEPESGTVVVMDLRPDIEW